MLGGAGGGVARGHSGLGKLDRDSGAPLCLAPTSLALALRGDRSREKLVGVASAHMVVKGEAAASRTSLSVQRPNS